MTPTKWAVEIIAVLAFIYIYPRVLISIFGVSSPWTSYLYMYGFGFLTFAIGAQLILSTGACKLGRGRDSKWFMLLVGGFCALATLHGTWVALALYIPFKGDM